MLMDNKQPGQRERRTLSQCCKIQLLPLYLPPPPLHGVEDLRGPRVGLQKQEAIRHRSGDEHLHVGPPLD